MDGPNSSNLEARPISERAFQIIRVGERAFELELWIYGDTLSDRQPLVILHSIEFAVPPNQSFCEQMWDNDLQVIFIRRAGYGRSSPIPTALLTKQTVTSGATAAAEAAIVRQCFSKLFLEDIILLSMGSANPMVYRLVHLAPEIRFTFFVNPMFNQEIWQVFIPAWFQSMLNQIVTCRSGLHVAHKGMQLLLRRDPVAFYKHIFEKNQDDLGYVSEHAEDYEEAGTLSLETSASQLYYDTIMCLSHDPTLKDGLFRNIHSAILIGRDSHEHWRRQMELEAARVGLPIIYAPAGDLLCAYNSPDTLLEAISTQSRTTCVEEQKYALSKLSENPKLRSARAK